MENYMGENGLAAEEEYKWGHYPPMCPRRTS